MPMLALSSITIIPVFILGCIIIVSLLVICGNSRKDRARLATFPELNPNPIAEIDFSGKLCYLNPAAKELFSDLDKNGSMHPFIAEFSGSAANVAKCVEKGHLTREVAVDGVWFHQTLVCVPAIRRIRIYGVDISERKKAEQILEQAAKTKSAFTSMVSHELRTPLTAIKEGISIVLDGSAGEVTNEQREFLDIAKRNVDRLARLINEVLDFQKLASGKMVFKMEENDINTAAREVQTTMLSLAQEKGLALEFKAGENIPRVRFDKDKIIQVLTNLVNNGIKFTEKGAVTIVTDRGDNFISVSVRDTGPGIKTEDRAKLFRDFEQLEIGLGRKTGGTGLGLAISREIIKEHKGKIWAESKVGEGSTFSFILPIEERRV